MAKNMDIRCAEELDMEYKDTVSLFYEADKIVSRTEEMYDLNRTPFKVSEIFR